jgi:hypothetical protein
MDWIQYYTVFALSGALVTWLQLYRPSTLLVGEANPEHVVCRHPFIGGIVWLSTAVIFIPVLAVPLLSDEARLSFIYNLTEGFLKK